MKKKLIASLISYNVLSASENVFCEPYCLDYQNYSRNVHRIKYKLICQISILKASLIKIINFKRKLSHFLQEKVKFSQKHTPFENLSIFFTYIKVNCIYQNELQFLFCIEK